MVNTSREKSFEPKQTEAYAWETELELEPTEACVWPRDARVKRLGNYYHGPTLLRWPKLEP